MLSTRDTIRNLRNQAEKHEHKHWGIIAKDFTNEADEIVNWHNFYAGIIEKFYQYVPMDLVTFKREVYPKIASRVSEHASSDIDQVVRVFRIWLLNNPDVSENDKAAIRAINMTYKVSAEKQKQIDRANKEIAELDNLIKNILDNVTDQLEARNIFKDVTDNTKNSSNIKVWIRHLVAKNLLEKSWMVKAL